MRHDWRSGLSRLPDHGRRVEFRRLGIVPIGIIFILILTLIWLVLLRVLAIR